MTVFYLLTLFVFLPAAAALVSETSLFQRSCALSIGSRLIYRQEEASTRPAPDACDIRPAERGEFYYYSVINYLCVIDVLDDGRIIAVARNNQRFCLWPNEPALRKARIGERVIYRLRFPSV